jgi:hypothetical protein
LGGNGNGLSVAFNLGAGSTMLGPGNAWASANYVGVAGSANILPNTSAALYITGVKLEVGNVATPFNQYSLAKSMADCQRYFVNASVVLPLQGYAPAANQVSYIQWSGPVRMRATPTVVAAWAGGTNATAGAISALQDFRTITSSISSVALGGYVASLTVGTLSAEL